MLISSTNEFVVETEETTCGIGRVAFPCFSRYLTDVIQRVFKLGHQILDLAFPERDDALRPIIRITGHDWNTKGQGFPYRI